MNLRKEQVSNFRNALWIVNENGIERTIPDSQEALNAVISSFGFSMVIPFVIHSSFASAKTTFGTDIIVTEDL